MPEDLDSIAAPAGTWAVFRTAGAYPQTLQQTWAATAAEWFPSNPWRLRPGPSIVAILDRAADFSTATCELWLPSSRPDGADRRAGGHPARWCHRLPELPEVS